MTSTSHMDLAGYRAGALAYESRRTSVRRGTRVADGAPVLLKILQTEDATATEVAALHHELELLSGLDSPHVGRALEMIRLGGKPALVLEDGGGRSLAEVLAERAPPLGEALGIATGIAAGLVDVHGAGILHNDVNPSNVVVEEASGRVLVIDFGLASRVRGAAAARDGEGGAAGTLAYIAPESTGRLARRADERSDLYGLGVTLYEMFTGQRPFTASDPQELVHAHIARRPRSPARVRPGLPNTLSDIILTLLEKDPDARYQTAAGLLADLRRCAEELEASGTVGVFPLREHDRARRFNLRERLYGREAELAGLVDAFERVADGPSETILIRGPSGIGKASLVRELKRVVAERRGFFIEGSFQARHTGRPYTGLADAFDGLVNQILKRPADRVARWRQSLDEALGDEARVIVDMLPSLAHVVGPQPDVPDLPADEAQARFTRRFRGFVDSVTRRGAALLVFLDDLQWADHATLDAVKERVLDASIQRVLLVATVREGAESARLDAVIASLEASDARPAEIALGPIDVAAVTELLGDAMGMGGGAREAEVAQLAAMIEERTGGAPFFIHHFIQELLRHQLIVFDAASEGWTWSLADIAARGFTDNVIDMMAARLAELPEQTRGVLRRAALVGDPFQLSVVAGSRPLVGAEGRESVSIAAALHALKPALEAGYVVPSSAKFEHADVAIAHADTQVCRTLYGELKFRFLHGRVQEAAAALYTEEEARRAHRQIGRHLVEQSPSADLGDGIHDILRHLNGAAGLEEDDDERYELARLNRLAAERAEATAAFRAALDYRVRAAAALPEDAWKLERRLTFEIEAGTVEAERVCGLFEEAKARATALMPRARTRTEKTRVLRSLMQVLWHLRDGPSVLENVKRAMALFDIHVPETEEELIEEVEVVLGRIARWERRHDVRELLELEPMDDPEQRLLMQLLMDASGSSWLASLQLQRLFSMLMLDISLEYGLAPETSFAVAHLSKERSDLDDPDQVSHALMRVAIELAERSGSRAIFARAVSHAVFGAGPALGLRERAELLRRGADAAYESGQGQFVGFYCYMQLQAVLALGDPLAELAAAVEQAQKRVRGFGVGDEFLGFAHYVDALRGDNPEDNVFLGSEEVRDRRQGPKGERQSPGWNALAAARVSVFCHGTGPDAWENIRLAGAIFRSGTPGMIVGDQCLFEGLIAAEMVRRAETDGERAERYETIEAGLRVLRGYRALSPDSYGLCVDLVEAEVAATRGETLRAMDLYHRAIDAAEREQRFDMLGLGQERAGRFFLSIDQPRIAGPFLAAARRTYRTWGATMAADRVDREHGGLLAPLRAGSGARGGSSSITRSTAPTTGSSSSDGARRLDARAVLEAAQALSSEVHLDRLLVRLMQIIIANAGADRALLLTRSGSGDDGDAWLVRAERRVGDAGDATLSEAALQDYEALPRSVVDYAIRTRSVVRLDDATVAEAYGQDPYIADVEPRSVLCVPALHQGELVAVIYLENSLMAGAFTASRLESVGVLAAQAAISIVNAHLYRDLRAASDRLMQSNERLTEYNKALEQDVAARFSARHIVGESVAMRSLLQDVMRISQTESPVLLRGEPGTGKEHIARVIHERSRRGDHAFVKVSCRAPGARPGDSEGETRAVRVGGADQILARFDLAVGGTLYLEDIEALGLDAQAGLVERLAAAGADEAGVRIVASTAVDLAAAVSSQRFSDDLYFRINAFPIRVPPLRERPDDIPVLVERLVAELAKSLGKRITGVTEESMAQLAAYRWPGNVTELRNVLERAAMVAETPTLHLTEALDRGVDAGSTLGSYHLVERVGAGGMGEVWRATHRLLRRPAAIKLIPAEVLSLGDASGVPSTTMRRFEREAQTTAQLRSPHTVELYDFGVSEAGTFYYVMELLDGVDLQTLIDRFGPIPAERVVHILLQACRSLSEAHAAGLVHRDIKAANIYLCRLGAQVDFVKVLDFGLVKHVDTEAQEAMTQLTAAGTVTGTPAYMAPEQASEVGEVTGQADLYALGCIAFWLLTGQLVFEASSATRLLMKHISEPPPRPSEISELDIPPALEALVMQCLEKDPDRRPASAKVLARGLREVALRSAWTDERADRWWATHLPA